MSDEDSPMDTGTPVNSKTALEALQTEEQRCILDTIAKVRKCGLEGTLSLPQIVVCGDQSSGKSSVLEGVTGIPFPRNDNLCTRYATEISLRNAPTSSMTIRVIPDTKRLKSQQDAIRNFERSIGTFDDLPNVMEDAMEVMGIGKTNGDPNAKPRAFSRDVLSIEYSGPDQPQLTLVDIPGLIGASSKGTTTEDISLVAEITQHYIKQPRTICLAVVHASIDYANQTILERVREVDPKGARTLGIITKPDTCETGSGRESSFIDLAQNKDIAFELGWHVVKNRNFQEKDFSLAERKLAEERFFRTTNWNCLPDESIGIDTLIARLSVLLFEHVKKELPALRDDLDAKLSATRDELQKLGSPRSSPEDCRKYLAELSLHVWKICSAAVTGRYEEAYFHQHTGVDFDVNADSTICRTRAVVQAMNSKFAEDMRRNGQKYRIETKGDVELSDDEQVDNDEAMIDDSPAPATSKPKNTLSREEALKWVKKVLVLNRGTELVGNFNPLIVGHLFFELSEKWADMATSHMDSVAAVCTRFLKKLLQNKCPEDVERKLWTYKFEEDLTNRHNAAREELNRLMDDLKKYPVNYNHYYTDTITKRRQERQKQKLAKYLKAASTTRGVYVQKHDHGSTQVTEVNVEQAISLFSQSVDPDMDNFGCEEALDCLFAIYKVFQKTFVANVTTQVIERHIVHGLEEIFSPTYVAGLTPDEILAIASEPVTGQRKRENLTERIKKLEEGRRIFRSVM